MSSRISTVMSADTMGTSVAELTLTTASSPASVPDLTTLSRPAPEAEPGIKEGVGAEPQVGAEARTELEDRVSATFASAAVALALTFDLPASSARHCMVAAALMAPTAVTRVLRGAATGPEENALRSASFSLATAAAAPSSAVCPDDSHTTDTTRSTAASSAANTACIAAAAGLTGHRPSPRIRSAPPCASGRYQRSAPVEPVPGWTAISAPFGRQNIVLAAEAAGAAELAAAAAAEVAAVGKSLG
mmetsp:Transcript_5994/g.14840  ORF Transcript_5994/g.14840 Transcript_5994/m.14840 type:complete len:246 (+) Transcript_5994:2347-3084(+)